MTAPLRSSVCVCTGSSRSRGVEDSLRKRRRSETNRFYASYGLSRLRPPFPSRRLLRRKPARRRGRGRESSFFCATGPLTGLIWQRGEGFGDQWERAWSRCFFCLVLVLV